MQVWQGIAKIWRTIRTADLAASAGGQPPGRSGGSLPVAAIQPGLMDEARFQAQKMESLGRLTGGVAHDFNNLLTVVLGNATALRMTAETRGDPDGVRRAEMIERAAERGGRLASQLLAFSRNQMLRPETISAYRVISAMHELLAQAAGEAVRVQIAAEPDLWTCHVDPGQLESAILNLVLNARDAMPDGGTIEITSKNERSVRADGRGRHGDWVRIDVRDTGSGIPQELIDKVFEPFFTTKPPGKGSGLGLAQVHGFAGQSGGRVELSSVAGRGTTVSLLLPRAAGRQTEWSADVEIPGPMGNNETILVVEPNDDLRATICEILTQSGYSALAASNTAAALAYLVSDEQIHVLLTEAMLPGGVRGSDLVRSARHKRPKLRALLTSGAPDEALKSAPGAENVFEFLKKPYKAADLVRVIGAMLKSETFSVDTERMLAEIRDIEIVAPRPTRRRGAVDSPASGLPVGPAVPVGMASRGDSIRIGVMPFRTTASENEYDFSLGLADEITKAFSRFRGITCVEPASVAALANEPPGETERWRQLDLDFLLEGTLRRRGEEIGVVARLINMRGAGELSWRRRFSGSMADMLNLQDQIAAETAAQVVPEVLVWEGREAARRPQVNPTAYDLLLRAIPAIYRLDQAGFTEAGTLLERSLELDPTSAACRSWLAHWYLFSVGQGWEADPVRASQRADQLAQQAIMLDPEDARGFTVAGHVRAFMYKESEQGLRLHERAIELNPNLAMAWCYSGLAYGYIGNHEESIKRIEHAQRLSPHDPHGFFFDMSLALAMLLSKQYESAARLGRRAVEAHPGFSSSHKALLSALGQLNAESEVQSVKARLFAIEPNFTISEARLRSPLLARGDLDHFIQGLRLAGLPD